MNRCVRVVGEDRISILPTAGSIVKFSTCDTFRDVFNKLAPDSELRVTSVLLTQTATTPAEDAFDTQEVDEKVSNILQLVAQSLGYDPMIITYVVTRPCQKIEPAPAHASPPSTHTAAGQDFARAADSVSKEESCELSNVPVNGCDAEGADDAVYKLKEEPAVPATTCPQACTQSHACDGRSGAAAAANDADETAAVCSPACLSGDCTAAGDAVAGSGADQSFPTDAEAVAWFEDKGSAIGVRIVVVVRYLARRNCGFQHGEPGKAVVAALEAVLRHITPALLRDLHVLCGMADSELRPLTAALHPTNPPRPTGYSRFHAIVDASCALKVFQDDQTIKRVLARGQWKPVRCFLSALEDAVSDDAETLMMPGGQEPGGAQAASGGAQAASSCRHCGTDCVKVGQKRRAHSAGTEAATTGAPPPAKQARLAAGARTSGMAVEDSFCVEASEVPYKGDLYAPIFEALRETGATTVADWEPRAAAIIRIDSNLLWGGWGHDPGDREEQKYFRSCMGHLKSNKPPSTFPYGVVSVRKGTGSGKKQWYAWRLPDGRGPEVRAAHHWMATFFNNDLHALRRQAEQATRERPKKVEPGWIEEPLKAY